ncbi:hypothetical protein COV82_00720 [Candidatus Peregrinibacteria bacterium CG11_big_fil_rev_8_21_14_0_20_46_8]|nr:MAG: hypothetical protein COV82_00720 [Candidatus Peregrinibacteria bacterium CG11_big_fil_rev_8_21_14_0_20_46_8]
MYKKEAWWSDTWDAGDYGREFDFNRPFFSQLRELIQSVPLMDLLVDKSYNSDYVNFCNNNKDCYLIFASNDNENCQYSSYIWSCQDSVDCLTAYNSELCYECVEVNKCYGCKYSTHCTNCIDCIFCEGCRNCQNCFGSVNLIGKQYCFFNEQLSKEEYEKRIAELRLDTHEGLERAKKMFTEHRLKFPMRATQITNCENSTGTNLSNCKNVQQSFDTNGAQDSKFITLGDKPISDCYDITGIQEAELSYYNTVTGVPGYRIVLSVYNWNGAKNLLYCVQSPSAQDCFGTVGFHKARHTILNKEYPKEEYEKMCARIIEHMQKTGEWGEFFPASLSPFNYNETIAQDHFPLNEGQAKELGWGWRPKDSKEFQPATVQIPNSIDEVTDEITKGICACEICAKNYRITAQELKFYRTQRIPVPKQCPDCRHNARNKIRTPWRLWTRECAKCKKAIQTSYAPNRPETIYCETCYLAEVY